MYVFKNFKKDHSKGDVNVLNDVQTGVSSSILHDAWTYYAWCIIVSHHHHDQVKNKTCFSSGFLKNRRMRGFLLENDSKIPKFDSIFGILFSACKKRKRPFYSFPGPFLLF